MWKILIFFTQNSASYNYETIMLWNISTYIITYYIILYYIVLYKYV